MSKEIMSTINGSKEKPSPTKEASTITRYNKESSRLIERYERACNCSFENDPAGLIKWMSEMQPLWKPSTWRVYKAAVCHKYLTLDLKSLYEALKSISADGCDHTKTAKATSSKKSKHLSTVDEYRILNYLIERKQQKWADETLLFIKSTLLTGLRPCEWLGAYYIPKDHPEHGDGIQDRLMVKNAKNTNGRSHGEVRHLLLGGMDENAMFIIREHMRMINKHVEIIGDDGKPRYCPDKYKEYQTACARKMKYVVMRLFPTRKKHPSLYTCRHQFSANLKNAGYSRDEIAALMGHATDETASIHYGKKPRSGKRGMTSTENLPQAHPVEVNRIRRVFEHKSANAPYLTKPGAKLPKL